MSSSTLRTIYFLVLIAHGFGHFLGLMPGFGLASTDSWHSRSWLLTKLLGETATRIIAIILWAAGLIGFIAAGLGLLGWLVPHDLWRTLAVISAIVSLVSLFFYWNSFPEFPNKAGAIAVNLAVLVGLLWANWPSEADIGY